MNAKPGQKSERHRNQRLPRVRYAAFDRLHSNRTILRDDRSVKAPVELYAEAAFAARNQSLGVCPGHA